MPFVPMPALLPRQFGADHVKILGRQFGLRQHLEMTLMHRCQAVPQFTSLFAETDVDGATVVQRAFLHEIAVFDHLLDIVRDVRAKVAAPQSEFPDGHLGIADAEQHHPLNVVDVVYPEPLELELHQFQELPVKALDERNDFEICVHSSLVLATIAYSTALTSRIGVGTSSLSADRSGALMVRAQSSQTSGRESGCDPSAIRPPCGDSPTVRPQPPGSLQGSRRPVPRRQRRYPTASSLRARRNAPIVWLRPHFR